MRSLLHWGVAETIERLLAVPGTASPTASEPVVGWIEAICDKVETLSPQNDGQLILRGEALKTTLAVGRTRLLLFGNMGAAVPMPSLVVLVFWLNIIFASYGFFCSTVRNRYRDLRRLCAVRLRRALPIRSSTAQSEACRRSPVRHCARPLCNWLSS